MTGGCVQRDLPSAGPASCFRDHSTRTGRAAFRLQQADSTRIQDRSRRSRPVISIDGSSLCRYEIPVTIEYDPDKRVLTLAKRGLDMADAGLVFAGPTLTVLDDRKDYGEQRFITIGTLGGRMVVIVWTKRGANRRIISMRKANDREQHLYGPDLG